MAVLRWAPETLQLPTPLEGRAANRPAPLAVQRVSSTSWQTSCWRCRMSGSPEAVVSSCLPRRSFGSARGNSRISRPLSLSYREILGSVASRPLLPNMRQPWQGHLECQFKTRAVHTPESPHDLQATHLTSWVGRPLAGRSWLFWTVRHEVGAHGAHEAGGILLEKRKAQTMR